MIYRGNHSETTSSSMFIAFYYSAYVIPYTNHLIFSFCFDFIQQKELERVGGVRALAWLIENRQVYGTSVDSFKDLNYPVSNSHSHTYHFNGASEYDDLHQAVKSILENAASVLCNLASVSCLKRSVLQEALIPSLLNVIIVPAATETTVYGSKDNGAESIISSMLFRIVTSLVR
ncbi:unnamed protein product [Trichobilharzia regenti]|nr:unnamed protein product [Trichobilharzia regenti]